MKREIIIAGFGGQGVLSMGKILAYSGLMEGKEVTWFPSYGPEQRGGTANVTVIVSDERISSPILNAYDIAIILNQPSLDKFERTVKPGGILIYDSYGIPKPPTRQDIRIYRIDAMRASIETDNSKAFNMFVLGGMLKVDPIVTLKNVMEGLKKSLPERHHHLLPANEKAILKGMEIIVEAGSV
jgi:2-oxoglutarate ferredoxin oxidoreductase subunit gamma